MATKIKGFYKGIKYISHIFVVKERELEIGNPTDVKHVAHIGWDGPSGSAPSWMSEFTAAPEFSSSLGTMSEPRSSKPPSLTSSSTSQELGSSMAPQASETSRDLPPSDIPKAPRKPRRRKVKSTSSPKSSASTRSSRTGKSKLKLAEADKVVNLQPL